MQLTPLDEAIQQAIHAPKGSVILADGADAPSGGAPGDSNTILRELLNKQTNVKILINIVDPEAVELVGAIAAADAEIIAPLGPLKVLCVVDIITSAYDTGD